MQKNPNQICSLASDFGRTPIFDYSTIRINPLN